MNVPCRLVAAAVLLLPGLTPAQAVQGLPAQLAALAWAQAEEERDPTEGRNVRRTATMREPVYRKLAEAQEAAEAEDLATAKRIIDEVRNMSGLSGYETAQVYNFLAYIAYTEENYRGAIDAYNTVLRQEDLPEAMRIQTIYSLAQLSFAVEDYAAAERYLRQWLADVERPTADANILLGQAIYSQERYADALPPLEKGIAMARQDPDKEVKEQWLLLLRVVHYELENYRQVAEVLEELVERFPKKTYWLQLSGIYGELEENEKRLITLELAHAQGLFDKEQEYLNLAQLLMQQDIPYRGARVLEEGLDKGIVERTYRNLRLLGQAYMMAQEEDQAIDPLSQAAARTDDADIDLQLANLYLNREDFGRAESAARRAIEKNTDRPGDAWFLVGMALYNQEKLGEAESAFREARKDSENRAAATQWLSYIEKERDRRAQLAAAMGQS